MSHSRARTIKRNKRNRATNTKPKKHLETTLPQSELLKKALTFGHWESPYDPFAGPSYFYFDPNANLKLDGVGLIQLFEYGSAKYSTLLSLSNVDITTFDSNNNKRSLSTETIEAFKLIPTPKMTALNLADTGLDQLEDINGLIQLLKNLPNMIKFVYLGMLREDKRFKQLQEALKEKNFCLLALGDQLPSEAINQIIDPVTQQYVNSFPKIQQDVNSYLLASINQWLERKLEATNHPALISTSGLFNRRLKSPTVQTFSVCGDQPEGEALYKLTCSEDSAKQLTDAAYLRLFSYGFNLPLQKLAKSELLENIVLQNVLSNPPDVTGNACFYGSLTGSPDVACYDWHEKGQVSPYIIFSYTTLSFDERKRICDSYNTKYKKDLSHGIGVPSEESDLDPIVFLNDSHRTNSIIFLKENFCRFVLPDLVKLHENTKQQKKETIQSTDFITQHRSHPTETQKIETLEVKNTPALVSKSGLFQKKPEDDVTTEPPARRPSRGCIIL